MPFVDNIEDLVQDLNLDMVIIITPPNQRLKLIENFCSVCKHILMEKPIERTTKGNLTQDIFKHLSHDDKQKILLKNQDYK